MFKIPEDKMCSLKKKKQKIYVCKLECKILKLRLKCTKEENVRIAIKY